MKMIKAILVITALMGLMACNSKKGGHGSEMYGAADSVQFYGRNLSPAEEKELLAKRTYYFGYDKFDVSDEDTLSMYAHAKRLIESPRSRVRIEGHTDERGSREYNVALGERRAKAVADIFMLKGVNPEQVIVVSYGKEKPAVAGSNEEAWSQNRRAVVVYEVE